MRQRIVSVLAGSASVLAMDMAFLAAANAQTAPQATIATPKAQPRAATTLPLRMYEHAMTRLERGDVALARELLELSAGDGFPEAAHALSLTYDTESLRRRGLSGDLADTAAKSRWTSRAAALGYRPKAIVVDAVATAPAVAIATAVQGTPPAIASAPQQGGAPVFTDGTFSSHVLAGCGEAFQSVMIKIERGTIAFEHVLKGVPYGWRGTIEPNGVIQAGVVGSDNHRAVGRFDEKSIDLLYPQCGPTPMSMRIRWLVR